MKKLTFLFTLALLMAGVTGVKAEVTGSWSDYRDATWGTDYESASTFTIANAEQLAQFAYMVNNGSDFSDKTVTLEGKIVQMGDSPYDSFSCYLSYYNWVPIGTADHPFLGTFNGNGKTINSVTITGENSYQGLFGYIGEGATVRNLVIDGCSFSGSGGAVVGYNYKGTVQNCVVSEATINGSTYVGNIIGKNEGTVISCYSIDCGTTLSLGVENSVTGADVADQAQCLYKIVGDDNPLDDDEFSTSTGTKLETLGSYSFYDDGIQDNYYHYYKSGTQVTITSNMPGYDVTFAATGATISGNVVTIGTSDVTLSVDTKTMAEWEGAGTVESPYIIYTNEQMNLLATRVNAGTGNYASAYYKLGSDIDYSGKLGYVSIGTSTYPFTGTFDGNGHVVDGLQTIRKDETNPYATEYTGLFGYVGNGGVVKNVKVDDPYMMGGNYTGGIVGYNLGTIDNCRINGERGVLYGEQEVQSTNERHSYGGIAGYNGGTIQNCVSAATIGSYTNVDWERHKVGGIVGHNANTGTVRNCLYLGYNLPDKEGNTYIGAIAGQNEGTLTGNLYRNNKYRSDGLSSYDNVGTTIKGVGAGTGVTGEDTEGAREAKRVFFKNDYSMSGIDASKLGVSGDYTETTNNPNSQSLLIYSNGLLFNDAYMAEKTNYQKGKTFYTTASSIGLSCDFDIEGYEAIFAIADYGEGTALNGTTLTLGTGDVTVKATQHRVPSANSWLAATNRAASFSTISENSITITSAAELGLLAYNVNFGGETYTYTGYTITLGANIDLAGHTWEPIGYGIEAAMYGTGGFLGTFDGAGHIISNMNVDYPMFAGLFSIVPSGATVKNVTISNAQVKGQRYVGVVAGACCGTIENCHVSYGNVELDTDSNNPYYIGGIAGMCGGGSIKGCTVMGTNIKPAVADAMGIGGIVGGISPNQYISSTATLMDCLFAGNIQKVEGNTDVGAIVGTPVGENTITNNYYVDGTNQQATPNTGLKAIGGADIENGAERAYAYDQLPTDIGTAGTQYDYSGVTPYSNGLHYALCYYTPIAPTEMDITLSNNGDNSTLLSTYNGITGKVTLGGRSFNKNGLWYTICLPFTIDDINAKDGDNKYIWPFGDANVEVKQFTEASFNTVNGELSLTFEDCYDSSSQKTTLAAGNPYLIRWSNTSGTIEDPVFNNVTITKTAPIVGDASNGVTFIGTFAGQAFTEDNRSILLIGALNNESILFYPKAGASLGAQRAYFQLDGFTAGDITAGARLFFGDDDATGINDNGIMINDHEAGAWYTIDGLKLSGKPTRKGLYIHNNRIVNIK